MASRPESADSGKRRPVMRLGTLVNRALAPFELQLIKRRPEAIVLPIRPDLASFPPEPIATPEAEPEPDAQPVAEAPAASVYDQDGLRTVHNHEFKNDPAFRAAYERGVQAVGWDYNWHWRVHVSLWAAATPTSWAAISWSAGSTRASSAPPSCITSTGTA